MLKFVSLVLCIYMYKLLKCIHIYISAVLVSELTVCCSFVHLSTFVNFLSENKKYLFRIQSAVNHEYFRRSSHCLAFSSLYLSTDSEKINPDSSLIEMQEKDWRKMGLVVNDRIKDKSRGDMIFKNSKRSIEVFGRYLIRLRYNLDF